MKIRLLLISTALIFTTSASAELVQQFKNPTFSGQGWASHVLTVEQMRQGAQNSVNSKAASEAAAAAAASQNTPLAKFMALFTGQVYSQLATQLTNNLFKECAGTNCSNGDFLVSETQKIMWTKINGTVTLAVYDGIKSKDSVTWNSTPLQIIAVPISSFNF
jgi:hypothetical protein